MADLVYQQILSRRILNSGNQYSKCPTYRSDSAIEDVFGIAKLEKCRLNLLIGLRKYQLAPNYILPLVTAESNVDAGVLYLSCQTCLSHLLKRIPGSSVDGSTICWALYSCDKSRITRLQF